MNAGKAVYGILSANSGVTDIVGTRIFPEIAEQEAVTPFVIYQLQSVAPEDTHDGPSKLDEVRFEFLCYADSYNEAADLGVAVRAALDRVSGTYNGVNVESVQFNDVDVEIEYDPRRYSQVLKFTFRIKRDDIEIALGTPVTGAELGDLSDVDVSGVTNGQLIAYNSTTGNWEAADDAGGAETLDDLTDVDAAVPSSGQLLAYGRDTWETIDQDQLTLPIGSVTGLQTELNTIPDNIDDLDDVKITGTPSEGEALVYQSGFWSRGTAGASTLGDLDDVNTTGAGVGSLIQFNGSTWDISAAELPDDAVYYHNRYASEAETLLDGATETVELYYTAQADGDGLHEDAQSDTPSAGNVIRRKLWYAEKAQADPDTSGDWTQFADIADDTAYATAKATLLAYLKARTGGTVPISLKMTWEDVAATSYLLDDYSGAAAAYSLRLLSSTYTGDAINVWNGTSYADIGFDGGELDTTALAAHCGSNDGFIRYWYDQSSNGNTATQATTANMPKIYDGTTGVVTEHGKPCAQFDGANDFFEITPTISAANGFIAAFVSEISATGATEIALNVRGANCAAGNQIFYNSSTGLTSANGRTSACGYQDTNASGMNSIAVGLWDWANDTLTVEFDGVAATPNTNITETSTTIDRIRLGLSSGVNYADCKIHECIIWPSNALTIADISDSINTFYNIY